MTIEDIKYKHLNECNRQGSIYKSDLSYTINEHVNITIQAIVDEFEYIKSTFDNSIWDKIIADRIDERINYYKNF